MSEGDMHWKTAITEIKPNEVRLRGYRVDELMGRVTFAQAVYLALTGSLPSDRVAPLLDAILVSSIDHGATPPSTLAARTAASTGAPLSAAVAAGILSINRHHGGAIEDCMRLILRIIAAADGDAAKLEQVAETVVAEYRARKERLPGLGHRLHSADPRTARLFALAENAGVAAQGVLALRQVAAAVAQQTGRELPVNVDGAIAAILVDLGLAPELGNAFFIIARLPGLVAHSLEEQTRERPVRPIHPTDHSYDGPSARAFPPAEAKDKSSDQSRWEN
jgi:citrate synthase